MKKFWTGIVSIVLSTVMCVTFAACGGQNGADGKDGKDGADGKNGKSAYEVWLENGHMGTEEDFLEWLKGSNESNMESELASAIANLQAHNYRISVSGAVYAIGEEDNDGGTSNPPIEEPDDPGLPPMGETGSFEAPIEDVNVGYGYGFRVASSISATTPKSSVQAYLKRDGNLVCATVEQKTGSYWTIPQGITVWLQERDREMYYFYEGLSTKWERDYEFLHTIEDELDYYQFLPIPFESLSSDDFIKTETDCYSLTHGALAYYSMLCGNVISELSVTLKNGNFKQVTLALTNKADGIAVRYQYSISDIGATELTAPV